jgi:hypothetical protein
MPHAEDNLRVGDLQSRLISPCARFIPDGEQAMPDVPAIFRRLMLFETYILQTVRFKEFVPLVLTLGIKNVLKLLNSGSLHLELDPTQIIQIGQMPDGLTYSRGKPSLPLLSFSFSFLRAAHYNEYVLGCLQDIHRELYGYSSQSDLMKLEGAILQALRPVAKDAGITAIEGHQADLRSNSPVLKKALAMKLRKGRGIKVSEPEIAFRVTPIDETDFKTESNLASFGLNAEEEHRIVESALLANGGLNSRIEDMKNHNALSGFIDDELPLFAGKFDFLTATFSPGNLEKTFDRVVKIRELPSFDLTQPDRSFDMERFLEIRSSKECNEFRVWLRTTMKSATDPEIHGQINTMRAKFGPLVHGNSGKGIRIAISTAIGFIPILGTAVAAVLSIVDSYLLEKLFPISGPTIFLSRQYPSLFEKRDPHHS